MEKQINIRKKKYPSSDIKCKFGNHKIGKDTLIFNMSSAASCPSRSKGMCEVINQGFRCYADKAESQYKHRTLNAREEQKRYWNNNSATTILRALKDKIERRKTKTSYFRFNESGDFSNQRDVAKLNTIAKGLNKIGITTYGYTSRHDLDFNNVNFLIKGSDCELKGKNNGKTMIIGKHSDVPKGYVECPGDCSTCYLCKTNNKINIAFRYH